ncbi:MAG TPA: lipase family protein [Patescibacteria group bacterium]|jgi:pimeloyl-ACP methyl ester carboxylesterase
MTAKPNHPHPAFRVLLAAVIVALLALAAWLAVRQDDDERRQAALQPFYDAPTDYERRQPGTVLKREQMDVAVPAGGSAERILYRSERGDGTPTVSSGMVFRPAGERSGRPVVAWAHGTIGLGDSCAPSRSQQPLADMDWLGGMLKRGWVVTATDYSGLGTAGISRYLVGKDEARDVLNSVRAARQVDPQSGSRFALWGHSQGGHSALWSAQESRAYAPELTLVGTAAGAPAAELVSLFDEQTAQLDSAAAWVIGSDVTATWPTAYPDLNLGLVTEPGRENADRIARECVVLSGIDALLRHTAGERFFVREPMTDPSWRGAAEEQTPTALPPNRPLLVAQSLSDKVVLPDTTALLAKSWCTAGSDLQLLWIDKVSHQDTAIVTGPAVTDWLGDRFAGKPTYPTCNQPLPIKPAA